MCRFTTVMLFAAMSLAGGAAIAQPAPNAREPAGETLYSTHCVACHTTQVHWRDKRRATDLASLANEVRRWQANARLGWSDDDVGAVVRYLNALYYHFPETGNRVSLAGIGSR